MVQKEPPNLVPVVGDIDLRSGIASQGLSAVSCQLSAVSLVGQGPPYEELSSVGWALAHHCLLQGMVND